MGRPARYTDDSILDTALALVSEKGTQGATVVAIAARLGAPSGSIYHRFASRDLLLAKLWIRTVQRFQVGFLEALSASEVGGAARAEATAQAAAQAAVAHTLEWSSQHRTEARVLTMYRREDLVALWPEALGTELSTLNDHVTHAMLDFAERCFGAVTAQTVGLSRFALIDLPHSAVRQAILDDRPLAPWLRNAVATAALAVLNGGEC